MKALYIRFAHKEALEARKQLISSEIDVMEVLKNIKKYKKSRNREKILKSKFKKAISSLKTEITTLQSTLPKEEIEETPVREKPKEIQETEKIPVKKTTNRKTSKKIKKTEETSGLEDELKAIQEKLAGLG